MFRAGTYAGLGYCGLDEFRLRTMRAGPKIAGYLVNLGDFNAGVIAG